MTYRRLFHILLIGSTLALAVAWWGSLRKSLFVSMDSPMPPFSAQGYLSHSTINGAVNFSQVSRWNVSLDHGPPHEFGPPPKSRLTGKFYWSEFSWDDPSDPHDVTYGFGFPVWAPYLLFVASAWGFCRVMERRLVAKKEKVLAEAQDTSHPD